MRSAERELVAWIGGLGAASAEDVARRFGVTASTARRRLRACAERRLLDEVRLLHDRPALFGATAAGLREAGRRDLEPVVVGHAGFAHLAACARVAVALELANPDASVIGEAELRARERAAGGPVASARLAFGREGPLHRPDLAVWRSGAGLPLAVEVELTVKGRARLRTIVRGWARSRLVEGVVYYATPPAGAALGSAVAAEGAGETVRILPLEHAGEIPPPRSTSPVSSPAYGRRRT